MITHRIGDGFVLSRGFGHVAIRANQKLVRVTARANQKSVRVTNRANQKLIRVITRTNQWSVSVTNRDKFKVPVKTRGQSEVGSCHEKTQI